MLEYKQLKVSILCSICPLSIHNHILIGKYNYQLIIKENKSES